MLFPNAGREEKDTADNLRVRDFSVFSLFSLKISFQELEKKPPTPAPKLSAASEFPVFLFPPPWLTLAVYESCVSNLTRAQSLPSTLKKAAAKEDNKPSPAAAAANTSSDATAEKAPEKAVEKPPPKKWCAPLPSRRMS